MQLESSKANTLRAYAQQLAKSNDTDLEEIAEDLIAFADQWENELNTKFPDAESGD